MSAPDPDCPTCHGTGSILATPCPLEADDRAALEEHARTAYSALVPEGWAYLVECSCTLPLPPGPSLAGILE